MKSFLVLLVLLSAILADTYFQEDFSKPNWESRWIESKNRDNLGKFTLSAGKYHGPNTQLSQGLQTSQDAKFYGISTKFQKQTPAPFNDKDLFIQYTVKHEQGIDCGGGYLKIFQADDLTDLTKLEEKSKYAIMFGPDVCGAEKKVHLIFEHQGKNLLWKKKPECKSDKLTHVYTLKLSGSGADKKYAVFIDGKQIESGKLEEDWEFLPPKQIRDPAAKKPADWVDEPMMADPNDKKPEDWENEPKMIPDSNAKKPEDWNDEEDGKWEAPKIQNPKYKGEWRAKMISNPKYKGPWEAPLIDNPEYKADETIANYNNLNSVAIEIWQVKSGSIFGNFLVTDDESVQKEHLEKVLKNAEEEKKKFDEEEEKKRKIEEEERKKREEEAEKKRKLEEEEKKKKEEEEKKKEQEKNVAQEIKKESEEKKAAPSKKDEL